MDDKRLELYFHLLKICLIVMAVSSCLSGVCQIIALVLPLLRMAAH